MSWKKISVLVSVVLVAIGFYMTSFVKKAPFLTVIGFVKMADGLGRQCPDLIELLKDEFDIGFIPLEKTRPRDVPPSVLEIVKTTNHNLGKVVFYSDQPWKPSRKNSPWGAQKVFKQPKNDQQIRICYTMLESSKIPAQWVEVLNNYFDVCVVPDDYLKGVFEACGVTIPLFTLPLGLNLEAYLSAPLKTEFNDPFRLACLGILVDRKNQMKLVEAYDLAFGKDPSCELLIHARNCEGPSEKAMQSLLTKLNNPRIKYQNISLDEKSYFDLFRSVDMLVNVSKGEGFSIQPRQAMALGIPVLLSNNTAQKTLVSQAVVASLETPHLVPAYYRSFKDHIGDFFDCDVEDMAKSLKNAYDNRHKLLEAAMTNRRYAASFDYRHLGQLYKNLVRPSKVRLSHTNQITSEGLETTSPQLVEKYRRLVGASE